MSKPTEPGRGLELGNVPAPGQAAPAPGRPVTDDRFADCESCGRRIYRGADDFWYHWHRSAPSRSCPELGRVVPLHSDMRHSLAGLSDAGKRAELVNPGRVVHVAIVTDIDGAPCEIGADYNTVKVGPYRFARDRMPELWAAIGEAAWLAGTIEQAMRDDDEGAS